MSFAHAEVKKFQNMPRVALAPLHLFLLQPILKRIVTYVARNRPELFARLGPHAQAVYVIDPLNLPFVLRLQPNPQMPSLSAHRRRKGMTYDAHITGSFLTLLRMIDGDLDGDALFFNRDLKVTGNTEAVVCLRNALDDLDGSLVDDIAAACGPLSRPLKRILSILRTQDRIL